MEEIRVVIPTKNEFDNILKIKKEFNYDEIKRVAKMNINFMLIDESDDNVLETIEMLSDVEFMDMFHDEYGGYGKSLMFGLKLLEGITDKIDKVVLMDADHPYVYIPRIASILSDRVNGYDVAVGFEEKNKQRVVAGWLCRNMMNLDLVQPTCGFIGFNYDKLGSIDINQIKSNSDFFHVHLLKLFNDMSFKIGQFYFTGHRGERKYGLKRICVWLKDFLSVPD